jgi:hypothetical protein
MPREQLRQLVNKLHQELAGTEQVDAESRRLLNQLTGDIEELVGESETGAEHHATALERAEEAALGFEAEHPQLAGVLREIMSALSRLGI